MQEIVEADMSTRASGFSENFLSDCFPTKQQDFFEIIVHPNIIYY